MLAVSPQEFSPYVLKVLAFVDAELPVREGRLYGVFKIIGEAVAFIAEIYEHMRELGG